MDAYAVADAPGTTARWVEGPADRVALASLTLLLSGLASVILSVGLDVLEDVGVLADGWSLGALVLGGLSCVAAVVLSVRALRPRTGPGTVGTRRLARTVLVLGVVPSAWMAGFLLLWLASAVLNPLLG